MWPLRRSDDFAEVLARSAADEAALGERLSDLESRLGIADRPEYGGVGLGSVGGVLWTLLAAVDRLEKRISELEQKLRG